jgi:SPP1 gp7 family putative phage head morphogenesis protein
MSYWQDRMAQAQASLSKRSIARIEKQMQKYYADAMRKCIEEFEATYDKVLASVEAGRQITPADLYKLDKYWTAQAAIRDELMKLGNKEIQLLSQAFESNWFDVYYSIVIPNIEDSVFNTVDKSLVQEMINRVWCADGKSWSERIWMNTEQLAEMLNEQLIHCVATGKKTTDLKNLLQERFGVSYSRADSLVRTEIAHIQTEAAKKRYEDYGIQEVEIWADEDERRCDVCGELHRKKYPTGAKVPIPAHPRCRCCIVPVVD